MCYVGTIDMLEIMDDAWINPDQVCSVKPAVMDRDFVDILTTDGTRYRVSTLSIGLSKIIEHKSISEVLAEAGALIGNLVRTVQDDVGSDFEVLNATHNT